MRALLGPVQFAHHAAASAVLDALACVWVAHGRRALSVNWGTWWSLQSDYRDRVARAGIRPMSAAVALDALGRLLAAGIPRAIVADFDRPILRDIYESRGSRRLLSELVNEYEETRGDEEKVGPPDDIVVDLSSLSRSDRLRAIDERVRLDIARVLGLPDTRSIESESEPVRTRARLPDGDGVEATIGGHRWRDVACRACFQLSKFVGVGELYSMRPSEREPKPRAMQKRWANC